MKEIGNIFLSWRKGNGARRHLVGLLKRNSTQGVRFSYLHDGLELAIRDGFTPYTEFADINKEYSDNVLDIFGQRLLKLERTDSSKFLSFWEIDEQYKEDQYYLLAHTMGLTPIDNYEFLADYNPVKNLRFTSDLAGLTYSKLSASELNIGDELRTEFEEDNSYDKAAIAVYKDNLKIGYIKKIHNRVFAKKRGSKVFLTIKGIEENKTISRVFVKICFDSKT